MKILKENTQAMKRAQKIAKHYKIAIAKFISVIRKMRKSKERKVSQMKSKYLSKKIVCDEVGDPVYQYFVNDDEITIRIEETNEEIEMEKIEGDELDFIEIAINDLEDEDLITIINDEETIKSGKYIISRKMYDKEYFPPSPRILMSYSTKFDTVYAIEHEGKKYLASWIDDIDNKTQDYEYLLIEIEKLPQSIQEVDNIFNRETDDLYDGCVVISENNINNSSYPHTNK